ncbi:MAG TPA: FHA domain-containing protein [Anaerolineae bacterium]|nr:FHA domain-containing protein [Anaerolineae bacterium]
MDLVTADGRRYTLKPGINVVGRSMDSDIPLDDGSMSRHHAELQWNGQQCFLVDLGSTNGTFVENQRLASGHTAAVLPGMQLRFGPNLCATLEPGLPSAARAVLGSSRGGPTAAPGLPAPAAAYAPVPAAQAGVRAASGSGFSLFFRAFDVALDPHKIGLAFAGLLLSMLVTAFFLWVMREAAAVSAALEIGTGLVGAGCVWLLLAFTAGTLSRLALAELGEGRRVAVRAALHYTMQNLLSFLLSPLLLLLGIVLVIVAEGILLLVGRIDTVGEIVVALAFLPLVLLNLGLLIIAMFGTGLTFPIVADRGGSTIDTLRQVLRFVRHVPGRLIAYTLVAALISLFLFLAAFYLVFAASSGTALLAEMGMEPAKFVSVFIGLSPGDIASGLLFDNLGLLGHTPPGSYRIAQIIFGLASSVLAMLALTIPQLFYLVSASAVYLNLRHDLPEPVPAARGWQAYRAPAGGPGQEHAAVPKVCLSCGSLLAYDQTYCPHCGQMQR